MSVIEGLIVQIINRAAGSFVKDVDSSKLSASLWSGSVHLNRLELKENAFDQLKLPFRIHRGFAENVKIVVPITNLYKGKWEVEVGGLYVTAGPVTGFKYDEATAAREEFERKQTQLSRVEEAKKKAEAEKEGKTEEKGFFGGVIQSLVAHILKVVQIRVGNVHIQYEDEYSHPQHPFSCGVTIEGLFLQSTDGQWKVGGRSDSDSLVFKLAELENLSVYWNSDTSLVASLSQQEWEGHMQRSVARGSDRPSGINYLFGPVSASARIMIHTKAGQVLSIPKLKVKLEVEQVEVSLNKLQFDGILSLLDSLDRMSTQKRFLQFRPNTPLAQLQGRERLEWFRYAVRSVCSLIHKRRVVWSWSHIRQVRYDAKRYQQMYKEKLLAAKPPAALLEELKELESRMSIFNITIARTQAESEVQRSHVLRDEGRSTSWASSWLGWAWSSSDTPKETATQPHVPTDAEIEAEKDKLYASIGYSEGAVKGKFPQEYVAYSFHISLEQIAISLHDDNTELLSLCVHKTAVKFEGRPSAGGVKIEAFIDSLNASGCSHGDTPPPVLVSTNVMEANQHDPLLSLTFELNPLTPKEEVKVDQRIILDVQPVQVVYDADTVDDVIKMFRVPSHVQLHRLSALALSKLADFQTQTRAGLEHALNVRKVLDIRVNLAAPYLVVPFGGKLSKEADVLVVDLGSLSIHSDWSHILASEREIREATTGELEESFYDHFHLKLKDTQILVAGKDDNWETARRSMTESCLHLLPPVLLNLTLKKSLVFNDPHRPNLIVSGDLPELKVLLSEDKVVMTFKLLRSLPLPPPSLQREETKSIHTDMEFPEVVGDVLKELTVGGPADESASDLAAEALEAQNRYPSASVSRVILDEESDGEDSSDEYLTASECSSLYDDFKGEEEGYFTPPLLTGASENESPRVLKSNEKEEEELLLPAVKRAVEHSPEQRVVIVQVKVDLSIEKVMLQFAVQRGSHGSESPRLSVEVFSLKADVCKRTFDLSVTASTGRAVIVDHFVQDLQHNKLIQSEQERLLEVQYVQVDRSHPEFSTQMHSTLKSIDANVSGITVQVVRESLADLLSVAKRLVEALSSPPQGESPQIERTLSHVVRSASITSEVQASKSAQVEGDSAGVDLCVKARFGGLGLSLWNENCEVMLAQIKDLDCRVEMSQKMTLVTASLGDLYVADRTSSALYEDIIRKVNPHDAFVVVKFVMFKYPNEQAKYKNISSPDIAVNVNLKQLRAIVRFRFLKALQTFASQLVLDHRMLESAKEAASTAATRTARAIQEVSEAESSESTAARIQLDIAMQAPLIAVLLEEGSRAALVGDLGHLTIKNNFLSVKDDLGGQLTTEGSIPAVVDEMKVSIESAKLSRTDRFDLKSSSSSEEFVICSPLEFHGRVRRKLSPWHKEVPSLEVFAEMGGMAVCVSPADVAAGKTLVDSATAELGGGQAARTEEGGGESNTEVEEKATLAPEEELPSAPAPSQDAATVVVHADVQSASLTLRNEQTSITEISVQGLHTDVNLGPGRMAVTASLQGAKVLDLLGDSRYQTIATFTDTVSEKEALSVQLSLFSGSTDEEKQQDMSKCDIAISGHMSDIKLVFVSLFIKRLQSFVEKLNSAVIDRAREFSAQQATKAVEELQQSSSKRIHITLTLGTPIIQVPLTSKSRESFVLQLGQLHIQNSFHIIGDPPLGASPLPVYDQMDVKLENISLCRRMEAEDSVTVAQRCLLRPACITAVVKRSLSPWYSGGELAKKVDVKLCIGETQLGVADDDVVKVLELLHGNLSEALHEQEEEERCHAEEPASDSVFDEEKEEEEEEDVEEGEEGEEEQDGGVDERTEFDESEEDGPQVPQVRVAVQVPSLSVVVYRRGDRMVLDDQSSWEHIPERQLVSLALKQMEFSFQLMTRSTEMQAHLLLSNCIMTDLRSNNSSSITEFIRRCPMANNQPLLKMDYDRSQPVPHQTAQTVNIAVQHMQVLLEMDFLFTLKDFADEIVSSSVYIAKRSQPKGDTHPPPAEKQERPPVKTAVKESSSQMHVDFKVEHPSITLLAKTGSGNEDALLMKGNIEGILSMKKEGGGHDNQGKTQLSTFLTNMSMFATTVSQLESPLPSQHILTPCSFQLNYSSPSSTDKDLFIFLESQGSIDFVLCPTDIRVLMGVVQATQRPMPDSSALVSDAPSNLGKLQCIDDTKWYLVKEESEEPSLLEVVEEAVQMTGLVPSTKIKREEVQVTVPKITMTLEEGLDKGARGAAFMLLVTNLSSNVKDWSSDVRGSASLSLQAAYFNKRFDVWEYLVEPLELENRQFQEWTMTAEINPLQAQLDMKGSSLAPKMLITVSADQPLQLTLTRSSVGRILSLVDEYTSPAQTQAISGRTQSQAGDGRSVIAIRNQLGERFEVNIKPVEKLKLQDGRAQVRLKNNAEVQFVSTAESSEKPSGGLLKQVAQRLVIEVTVSSFKKTLVVVSGCNTTYYPLKPAQGETRHPFGFVVEVESVSCITTVLLRSPVQVVNQLMEPCLVAIAASHHLTPQEAARAVSLDANNKYSLPLGSAHSGHVFVKLKERSVEFSDSYIKWNSKSEKETLRCAKTGPEVNDHYIRVSLVEEVYSRGMSLMNMAERAHHLFALHYPLVIQNYLPYRVQIKSKCLPTETIERGKSVSVTTCALCEPQSHFGAISRTPKLDFTVTMNMDGADWQGKLTVEGREDKADQFTVQHDKEEKTLAVHKEDRGPWKLSVYAPYWIINKTHFTLEYSVPSSLPYHRSSEENVVSHQREDPDADQPSIALLRLSSDLFKSSTNLQVRIQMTRTDVKKCPWSKDFSLDTVGYAGVISIEHGGTAYNFGVKVQLSSHQLTKIVTLSPFFLLENQTKHIVYYFEPAVDKDGARRNALKPKEVVPFHPAVSSTTLQISLGQQSQVSMPFTFIQPGSLLVRTEGKPSAVCVNVKATDQVTLVSFAPYFVGSAPFLIVNNTKGLTFKVEQIRDSGTTIPRHVRTILSGHTYLYTWDNPLGKKELMCVVMGPGGKEMRKFTIKPEDAQGKYKLPKGYKRWLSLTNAVDAMMLHGGSRRSGSASSTYKSESEMSEDETDCTAMTLFDQWFHHDVDSSGAEEDDSDVELEDTDGDSSTTSKRSSSASQKIKKIFSFKRSTADSKDASLFDKMKGRWVCFMDSIQRVLLFTLNKDEVRNAMKGQSVERPHLEFSLSLRFAGLSLVDDLKGQEVAYLGLMPCPVVWEWEKRPGYWRTLKLDEVARLEESFQDYAKATEKQPIDKELAEKFRSQTIDLQDANWTVEFDEEPIRMTSLKQGEVHRLRRSAFPGVFFKYTYSPSQTTVRARVFNVQLDNQLPKAMYPQVLYAIPPPPSIASSLEPKPLVDASVIMRNAKGSQTKEFKLIQVLLQKIGVEIELGFILAMSRLLSDRKKRSTDSEDLESDLVQLKQPLHELLLPALTAAQKAYFDTIHLSPVHIILSLSLTQTLSSKEEMQEESLSVFSGLDPLSNIKSILQSLGTFIVDVRQAELKLNYFDASQVVLTTPELVQLVKHHYTQQVLLKLYKVVFNLNVIGNPVGLLGGLASGVADLFYEPFQGIMVGPEEFVEALGIGVHSAIGGTVGGALGVVGALTGKLGDAAAFASLDKWEREHRRVEQRQGHLGYGVGGLLKGIGGAITNIVIQPVRGARTEGVVGFIKGAGRGVLGIVLRPVGGVLDLTSIAVDKLRKVTKIDDYEIVQIRLPRHIAADSIVRPYSHFFASGKAFFMELEPNASSDLYYITHFPLAAEPVKAFMVTNKYAVLFSQSGVLDILKKWDQDETVEYDKMTRAAEREEDAMQVKVKKELFSSLFRKEESIRIVFTSADQAQEATTALNEAYQEFVQMKSLL